MKKLYRIATNLGVGGAAALWGYLLYKRGKASAYARPMFGLRREWERFVREHRTLSERLGLLNGTMTKVFIREGIPNKSADHVVFFLGRKACEEFHEILLLCGNGYGVGATKLLRTLYENAVTAAYIGMHQDEADMFFDFSCIHEKRMLENFKKIDGLEIEKALPTERIEGISDSYESVKDRFQTTDCKKCGTKRLQQSWTKKSPEQLANILGERYKSLYVFCYFLPMLQTHSTAKSMVDQMELKEGLLSFDMEAGRKMVNTALIGAHRVLLAALRTQDEYFKLGLESEIEEREKDFLAAWKGRGWN